MRFHKEMLLALVVGVLAGCRQDSEVRPDIYDVQRRHMIRFDLKEHGIKSEAVLNAMQAVPRHLFLESQYRQDAYKDLDLPIASFLTTPNPYVAAKTIELLNIKESDRVLEVGTGRGYQTALMAELAKEVYTIEIVPEVFKVANETFKTLNYRNVHTRLGDGYKGWPEQKPFDSILVSASAKEVPQPLLDQLRLGGRLVMPIDDPTHQQLVLYRKTAQGLKQETIMSVNLGQMEGEAAGRSLSRRPRP